MKHSGLLRYLLIYIFVVQLGAAWYLWSDASFVILAGINWLALAIGAWTFGSAEEKKNIEKTDSDFVREFPTIKDEKYSISDENPILPQREKKAVSSGDIEHVRARFHKPKAKPQTQEGGAARLIIFLFAVLGLGGILFMMRENFDFIAMGLGSLLMALFVMVSYKAMNIWKKSIFSSLYFLCFLGIFLLSLWGIFASETNTSKIAIKDQLSTFIAGLHWEVINVEESTQKTGYLYESTGSLISETLSGTSTNSGTLEQTSLTETLNSGALTNILYTGEQTPSHLQSGSQTQKATETILPIQSGDKNIFPKVEKNIQAYNTQTTGTVIKNPNTTTPPTSNGQVSLLEGIKYLISAYKIPLSSSKKVKFTHIAQSDNNYPYMKTALEKRMIGTKSNPNTPLSCDTYIVMKGLALNWAIEKTANIKAEYRNVAESKGMLNGCIKGKKLTPANL